MSSARAWGLLALGLTPLLVLLAWWSGAGVQERSARSVDASSGAAERAGSGSDARRSSDTHSAVDSADSVVAQLVGGEAAVRGYVELRCVARPEQAQRVQLDAHGSFASAACGGPTCVRLEHPSLQQREPWVLEPGEPATLLVDSAELVEGQVVGSGGELVANAELWLVSSDGRRLASRTDVDGRFALSVPALRPCDACDRERGVPRCREAVDGARADRVMVRARGYAPLELELELELAAASGLELVLGQPAAPLRGRVLGEGGQAFTSRTTVLATNMMAQDGEQHAALVDEQGRFVFDSLGPARYRLRALRDGLELARAEDLAPGDEVDLQAQRSARGRVLRVRILDAGGVPVAAAQVDGGPFRVARTDENGSVEAPAVLAGTYLLRVRAGSCAAARVEARVPADGSDLDPEPVVVEHHVPGTCHG